MSTELIANRKHYINKLKLDIQIKQETIRQHENSQSSLRVSSLGTKYVSSQLDKLSKMIEDANIWLEQANQKIEHIEDGRYDQEFSDIHETTLNVITMNKEKKTQILIKEKKEKEENMKNMNKQNKLERTVPNEKEMDRSLKYYWNVIDSIPDYIENNLSNMPNNKGYIWRGVYLYGYLPDDRTNKTVMFETKSGIKYIHEWNYITNIYTLYTKENKDAVKKAIKTREIICK